MSRQRKILLPLLVASLVLLLTGVPCNSFAPLSYNPPVTTLSCSTLSHPPTLFVGSNHPRHSIVSQVAAAREGGGGTVHENSDGNNDDATAAETTTTSTPTTTKPNLNNFLKQRRMGKEVIGSAFLALTLSLSPSFSNAAITYDDPLHHPSTPTATISSTILLSRGTLLPPDDAVIAELTLQTKEIEREAAKDKKRADVEKSIAAFFDYDARMAEEQEARIEAAEFRAEAEASYDKEQAELLKIEERKAEKEFRAAQTPQEKRSSAMKARELLRKEKEIERRERRAERDEQIYLAEERQEQIILKQKEEAKEKEEKKFIAVEKEYENVAELAKEEEVELSLLKKLSTQKK